MENQFGGFKTKKKTACKKRRGNYLWHTQSELKTDVLRYLIYIIFEEGRTELGGGQEENSWADGVVWGIGSEDKNAGFWDGLQVKRNKFVPFLEFLRKGCNCKAPGNLRMKTHIS